MRGHLRLPYAGAASGPEWRAVARSRATVGTGTLSSARRVRRASRDGLCMHVPRPRSQEPPCRRGGLVDDSRRTLPGVPVERPASLGTQSAAVPAWVFVLLVALPVAAGWFVALSLDLSWVRASAGVRGERSRGQVARDRGTEVPGPPAVAALAPDSGPAAADTPPLAVDVAAPRVG